MWVDPWVRKIPWGQDMATHLSSLAWAIPWTEKTIASQRVGVDWSNLARMYTREWNEATITLAPCMYIYLFMYIYIFTTPYQRAPGETPCMICYLFLDACKSFPSYFIFNCLITTCLGVIPILFILFEVYWASCIYKYIFSPNLGYFSNEFFTYFVSTLVSFLPSSGAPTRTLEIFIIVPQAAEIVKFLFNHFCLHPSDLIVV